MTTYYPFEPNPDGPFTFQPTFDGNLYTISVEWLLFGARYYVRCQDLNGNDIFYRALISSPTGIAIQTMSWASNSVSLVALEPHGFRTGETVKITVAGVVPAGYNGTFIALATGPTTLSYPLGTNPGALSTPGVINQNLDIAASFFTTSTLVYRDASATFEVTP